MSLFSFNRTPKPSRYNFKPRYYDADKEDLDRRVRWAKIKLKEPENDAQIIKSGFRRITGNHRVQHHENPRIYRLTIAIITLSLLISLGYLFVRYGDYFLKLFG